MIKQTAQQPDSMLRWMGSLADETRIRLLRMLERHELGVSDLCDIVRMPQSTVSRHLKMLSDEGWIVSHRRGTTNLYRMLLDELDSPQRKLWLLTREQTTKWATLKQDQLRLTNRLRSRGGDSRAFFAGAAGQWDKMRSELYGANVSLEAALALLDRTWTVADLGCGTGVFTEQLSRHVGQVIGVDNSDEMLVAARQNVAGRDNVDLRLGALEQVPIDNSQCDGALATLVLTYLSQPMAAVSEMVRILKPGGRAVIVDLLRHDEDAFRRHMGQQSLGFSQENVQRMLEEAGFVQINSGQMPPESGAKGPALLVVSAVKKG